MTTKLTEKIFRAVKIMTTGGATAHEISDCFGISITTVNRVRGAESIEEYRTMLAADYGKKKKGKAAPVNPEPVKAQVSQSVPLAQLPQPQPQQQQSPELQAPQSQSPQPTQVIEHRQTVTVQATHYMMQEMKKTNELLELISRKLAFIVDQLS